MREQTFNWGTGMSVFGFGLQTISLLGMVMSGYSKEEPKVNSNRLKGALNKCNMRHLPSRAAIGFFFAGSLIHITGEAINAARDQHSDETDDNNTKMKSGK